MIFRSSILLFSTLLFLGCNRGAQTPEAVRQGVIDYLASRSNLDINSMQVDVTSVSFRQNEADATVSFRPKGGAAGAGMSMKYTLELKGNRWVVKKRADTGGSPHGGGEMPPQPGAQQKLDLPEGHPPMGSSGQQSSGSEKKDNKTGSQK